MSYSRYIHRQSSKTCATLPCMRAPSLAPGTVMISRRFGRAEGQLTFSVKTRVVFVYCLSRFYTGCLRNSWRHFKTACFIGQFESVILISQHFVYEALRSCLRSFHSRILLSIRNRYKRSIIIIDYHHRKSIKNISSVLDRGLCT